MATSPIDQRMLSALQALRKLFTQTYSEVRNYTEDERQAIHRFARISMVGASTRIENAVLTDPEIEWIDTVLTNDAKTTAFDLNRKMIENKLSKDRERSIEEVVGCRAMLHLLYSQGPDMFPLSEIELRGLHSELLKHYPEAARYRGNYKTNQNSVVEIDLRTKKRRTVFKTADAGLETKIAMAELLDWYNQTAKQGSWSVAIASELTFRFLAIHPFQDGNGRLGRGIFLMALMQSPDEEISYLAPFLAIDRHIERHRAEYYAVLNQCSDGQFKTNSEEYEMGFFLKFMIKTLTLSLRAIPALKERHSIVSSLSGSTSKVLECFKDTPEERLRTQEISTSTDLPRRTVIYALNKLLKHGLIQKYGQGSGTRYQLVF